MFQSEFNRLAEKYTDEYVSIKKEATAFEPKGIFHSELLMLLTYAVSNNIEKIIESGRARGQSTEIIARICKKHDIEFHSIEFDKNSPDVEVAENRLRPLSDVVTLHYGDGFEIMPRLLDDKRTLIVIDGPKGIYAQKLALLMLKHPPVKAIMLHDTHRDANDARDKLERYLGKHLIVSDDYQYVEKFRFLDDECWEITSMNSATSDCGPYKRGKRYMRSYAGTLTCIQNEDLDQGAVSSYLREIENEIMVKGSFFFKLLSKMRFISFLTKANKRLAIQ